MDDEAFARERAAFRQFRKARKPAADTRPFIVKYRPTKLADVVGHEPVLARLGMFVRLQQLPNLLFEGPPGVGKTTCGTCLANEVLGESCKRGFLWLNASDDRNATFVSTVLREFVTKVITLPGKRIVFLDEVDSMTRDAQLKLKRLMDASSATATFILACNDLAKVEEPVAARCVHFAFGGVAPAMLAKEIRRVADLEKVAVDDSGLSAIVRLSGGDVRRGLNALQACADASPRDIAGPRAIGPRAESAPVGKGSAMPGGSGTRPGVPASTGASGPCTQVLAQGPSASKGPSEGKSVALDGAAVCRLCDVPDIDAVQAIVGICARGDAFGAVAAADALINAGHSVHDVLRTLHDVLRLEPDSRSPLPPAARYKAFVHVSEALGRGKQAGSGPSEATGTVHVHTPAQLRACIARICLFTGTRCK
jgi:hypothetical protein